MSETVSTYDQVCQFVAQWGIVPLSHCIPEHPSLNSVTISENWFTGQQETDPWQWRARLTSDGIAAYGRFFVSKPMLISSELFPLLRCVLSPSEALEERYAAGLVSREALRLYSLIAEYDGIDARELRRQSGMAQASQKHTFERALIDLQSTAEVVIAGTTARLNAEGNKSGWNSACYSLAETWMAQHQLTPLTLPSQDAQARLLTWLEGRWQPEAIQFLRKQLARRGY